MTVHALRVEFVRPGRMTVHLVCLCGEVSDAWSPTEDVLEDRVAAFEAAGHRRDRLPIEGTPAVVTPRRDVDDLETGVDRVRHGER